MKTVAFLRRQLNLCCQPTQSPPIKLANQHGKSGIAGVVQWKLILFAHHILHFVTDMFDKGHEYCTINVLRSALSSVHGKIDGL